MVENCTSDAPSNSLNKKPAECIKDISKIHKECSPYEDGNEFCFKFKENVNNHSIPSRSKYWFNGQKRRVPAKASDVLPDDDAREDCDLYCDELGGLETVETSSSLIPGLGPVTNSIVSYSDLDDMCDGCA